MSDLQTLLQGYRMKYGLEQQEAKQSTDPFANAFEQPQQQQGDDWMPMGEVQQEGPMSGEPDDFDEAYARKFAEMADSDPILSRGLDERSAAIDELRMMVQDPNNPMDDASARELLVRITKGE